MADLISFKNEDEEMLLEVETSKHYVTIEITQLWDQQGVSAVLTREEGLELASRIIFDLERK